MIHADADPRWVKWSDLAPWENLFRSLTYFGFVEGAPLAEDSGCLVLRNPQLARYTLPLTNIKCPTLCILMELRRRGWRMTLSRVLHSVVESGLYDAREPDKMKPYFLTLLQIEQCMPLAAPNLPSDQPLSYYRLLLSGQPAQPGFGDRHYVALLRGAEAAKAPMPIADDSDSSSDYKLDRPPKAKAAIAWYPGPHEGAEEGDPLDPRGALRAIDGETDAKAKQAKSVAGKGSGAKSSSGSVATAKSSPPKPPAPKAAPPLPPPPPHHLAQIVMRGSSFLPSTPGPLQ